MSLNRARDTRLGRDVAVKVLPEAVASSPDRLARWGASSRPRARQPGRWDHVYSQGVRCSSEPSVAR